MKKQKEEIKNDKTEEVLSLRFNHKDPESKSKIGKYNSNTCLRLSAELDKFDANYQHLGKELKRYSSFNVESPIALDIFTICYFPDLSILAKNFFTRLFTSNEEFKHEVCSFFEIFLNFFFIVCFVYLLIAFEIDSWQNCTHHC